MVLFFKNCFSHLVDLNLYGHQVGKNGKDSASDSFFKLGYNSLTIKFTSLEYTSQGF